MALRYFQWVNMRERSRAEAQRRRGKSSKSIREAIRLKVIGLPGRCFASVTGLLGTVGVECSVI